jgi:hypothetical protein
MARHAGQPPDLRVRDLRPEQLTEADAPEGRRAAVTQHGVVAAREHRRQPPCLLPQAEMPDRVHAAMHPMQPPRPTPVVDGVLPQPQLPTSHNSVLTARQGSQLNIRVH